MTKEIGGTEIALDMYKRFRKRLESGDISELVNDRLGHFKFLSIRERELQIESSMRTLLDAVNGVGDQDGARAPLYSLVPVSLRKDQRMSDSYVDTIALQMAEDYATHPSCALTVRKIFEQYLLDHSHKRIIKNVPRG